ncbi:glycogen-binding domain-containing protein [Pseudodesulfovibrio sp. zrk46]|uniref:glycogen-binding domain-containing protein n=1 Tax=Pseudodesulfovibrio sp. zrk46 TaxID=2725288 RepID=UPI001448DE8C|nr:glycogen-binding domain-containing protein [Pseudodesulfovibrio sp. zrk46]QJB57005.1 glycoside hydrolase family 13 [Pseudodesulfovibrio sp. zrk46]
MPHRHNGDPLDANIMEQIRNMPERPVPADFSARVMSGLQPKKPSAWMRFKLWLTKPRSFTFTPLQAAPALACALVLLVFGFYQMQGPSPENGVRLTSVRFVMDDAGKQATSVSVIGSFNDWKTEESSMWYDQKNGKWVLEAKLPPGDHEYVFLVDGNRLVPDPQAAMTRDDGFGNKNSILFVNGDHEQHI